MNCFNFHRFSARNLHLPRNTEPRSSSRPIVHNERSEYHIVKSANFIPDNLKKTKTLDYGAVRSYIAATITQWSLITIFIRVLDLVLQRLHLQYVSTIIVSVLFLFLSLRSRVFSPLDNSRPKATGNDPVFKDRKRPSWQPPPIAFPIIWSTIALLRTVSSVFVWQTTGTLFCLPLLTMALHLSLGDTWNTINNVEKRLGTAVVGVSFVLFSVYLTAYLYWRVRPLAGFVLAPSCLWISIATYLVYSIWRLNLVDFGYPSLFPSKEEGPPSRWRWQSPFAAKE